MSPALAPAVAFQPLCGGSVRFRTLLGLRLSLPDGSFSNPSDSDMPIKFLIEGRRLLGVKAGGDTGDGDVCV